MRFFKQVHNTNCKSGFEIILTPYYMGIEVLEDPELHGARPDCKFFMDQIKQLVSNRHMWNTFYNHIYITIDFTNVKRVGGSFLVALVRLLGKYTAAAEIKERVRFINTSGLSQMSKLALKEWDGYLDNLSIKQAKQLKKDRGNKKVWNKKIKQAIEDVKQANKHKTKGYVKKYEN